MDHETLSFVVAAYGLTWVVLLSYAWLVHRTLRRARDSHDTAMRRAGGEGR